MRATGAASGPFFTLTGLTCSMRSALSTFTTSVAAGVPPHEPAVKSWKVSGVPTTAVLLSTANWTR